MRRVAITVAAVALAGCSGGTDVIAPESLTLTIVAPTAITGEFGEAVPISVMVNDANGGPRAGATVTFTAADGSVSPTMVITDASGLATALWTLATMNGPQTATATVSGGRTVTFTANAANGWKVFSSATLTYARRLADPGVTFGHGASWASTRLGSPPALLVGCFEGTVLLAVVHPNLITLDGSVIYSIDDTPKVGDTWLEQPPEYAVLYHPGPPTATSALVQRMAAAKTFTITFRHYVDGEIYSPNFTMAGLSLLMPELMANCPVSSG